MDRWHESWWGICAVRLHDLYGVCAMRLPGERIPRIVPSCEHFCPIWCPVPAVSARPQWQIHIGEMSTVTEPKPGPSAGWTNRINTVFWNGWKDAKCLPADYFMLVLWLLTVEHFSSFVDCITEHCARCDSVRHESFLAPPGCPCRWHADVAWS